MKVGFIGLGKLGLPVAVSMAIKGHDVLGFDRNPERMTKEPVKEQELGPDGYGNFNTLLAGAYKLKFAKDLEEVAEHADLIFMAIQTPHDKAYEGITPIPEERKDFDYTYLKDAVRELAKVVRKGTMVVVISTCLPGTMRREILPLVPDGVNFVYNPFFIAMGTVMRDFLHPEFVLIGSDSEESAHRLVSFYRTVLERGCPFRTMSIESAELTKVAYNTFISFKIGFVNTLMEICHAFPEADIDEVTGALKCACDRLISPAYLTGGMGDGGGCHPRDNIAMSWLARKLELSFDLFEAVMKAREGQAQWLANLMYEESEKVGLPMAIYGVAFKPNTKILTGSHAVLVSNLVKDMLLGTERVNQEPDMLDPVLAPEWEPDFPAVYLIGCNHAGTEKVRWPVGSVVIDPFRVVLPQEGVKLISLGAKEGVSHGGQG
jgi:UDPglucose 6-dehydrogenase